jgi:hypothetical protein
MFRIALKIHQHGVADMAFVGSDGHHTLATGPEFQPIPRKFESENVANPDDGNAGANAEALLVSGTQQVVRKGAFAELFDERLKSEAVGALRFPAVLSACRVFPFGHGFQALEVTFEVI